MLRMSRFREDFESTMNIENHLHKVSPSCLTHGSQWVHFDESCINMQLVRAASLASERERYFREKRRRDERTIKGALLGLKKLVVKGKSTKTKDEIWELRWL